MEAERARRAPRARPFRERNTPIARATKRGVPDGPGDTGVKVTRERERLQADRENVRCYLARDVPRPAFWIFGYFCRIRLALGATVPPSCGLSPGCGIFPHGRSSGPEAGLRREAAAV